MVVRNCEFPVPKPNEKDLNASSNPRRVGAAAFHMMAKQHGVRIFALSIHEINAELKKRGEEQEPPPKPRPKPPKPKLSLAQKMFYELYHEDEQLQNHNQDEQDRHQEAAALHLAGFSLEDIQLALQSKAEPDPRSLLPDWLQKFAEVFDRKEADKLPPH